MLYSGKNFNPMLILILSHNAKFQLAHTSVRRNPISLAPQTTSHFSRARTASAALPLPRYFPDTLKFRMQSPPRPRYSKDHPRPSFLFAASFQVSLMTLGSGLQVCGAGRGGEEAVCALITRKGWPLLCVFRSRGNDPCSSRAWDGVYGNRRT